jgi:hypothetical protein
MRIERRLRSYDAMLAWSRRVRRAAAVGTLALAGACAGAGQPVPEGLPAPSGAVLEPAAASVLHEMSGRLASIDNLTFDATRHMDAALLEGRNVAEDAQIHVMVKRPNKVHAVSRSNLGVRHFYFDGQSVTVYDESKNMYATVPMEGTIDEMVERLEERFDIVPPLAEFVVNDPWAKIQDEISAGRIAGTEEIGGKSCQKLQLTGETANADLWVSVDEELPCRLVATFTKIEGNPQVRADFSNWRRDPGLTDDMFIFKPPPGARKIPMVPASDLDDGQ